jgi:hypothetical protein
VSIGETDPADMDLGEPQLLHGKSKNIEPTGKSRDNGLKSRENRL